MQKAPAAAESRSGSAPESEDAAPRDPTVRPLVMTALFISALFATSFYPSMQRDPMLALSTRVAAGGLALWAGVLALLALRAGRALRIDVRVIRAHWVQACCHFSILVYWGTYDPLVPAQWAQYVAQILFLYALDMLLMWSRRGTWTLGAGPFPIIFSTNFFLWFKDDWWHLQYVMVAGSALAKELLRWKRDGRSAHIFNPSSFGLAVASAALIVLGREDISWGVHLARSIEGRDAMYFLLFALSLVPHYLFSVTPLTLSAVLTVLAWDGVFHAATGGYFFVGTSLPMAVFLGSIFLFTDPATSPRTFVGKLIYGVMYGLGVCAIFWWFDDHDLPSFYDKLLPVPLMNLCVRAIDRFVDRRAPDAAIWRCAAPARVNHALIAIWCATFAAMWATSAIGRGHPGASADYWQAAADRGVTRGKRNFVRIVRGDAEDGSPAAADRFGRVLLDGKYVAPDPDEALYWFLRAAPVSHRACADAIDCYLFRCAEPGPGAPAERQDVVRARTKAIETLAADGAQGDARANYLVGMALVRGKGVPRDTAAAATRLQAAAQVGWLEAFEPLARLYDAGDGVPRKPDFAAAIRKQEGVLRARGAAASPTGTAIPGR